MKNTKNITLIILMLLLVMNSQNNGGTLQNSSSKKVAINSESEDVDKMQGKDTQLFVKFKKSVSKTVVKKYFEENELQVEKYFKNLDMYLIRLSINNIRQTESIAFIEPVRKISPMFYQNKYSDKITTEYWQQKIQWYEALNFNPVEGEGTVTAVIDVGVQLDHPNLTGKIFTNNNEIAGDGIDNDNNGYTDDVSGWNSYDDNNNVFPVYYDGKGSHGTEVSGVVLQVAPETKILPIKFYDYRTPDEPDDSINTTSTVNLVEAFEYILEISSTRQERFIINLSWGWDPVVQPQTLVNIINTCVNRGIPVFCASGNFDKPGVQFPANLSNTIAVTRSDENDNYVASNHGPEVTLIAPGESINTYSGYSGWQTVNGTSYSSPMVAGAAALLFSAKNDLNVNEIKNILISSADKIHPSEYDQNGHSDRYGYGRLNVYNAFVELGKIIAFYNDVEGNKNIGSITIDGTSYASGYKYIYDLGVDVETVANEGYTDGGSYNKFYNWLIIDEGENDRADTNNFIVTADVNEQIAYFKETKPLTLRNSLEGIEEAGNIWFGEIDFDTSNVQTGHIENAYKYQTQEVEVTYLAEAEASQFNGYDNTTWEFAGWSDGSTDNPYTFQVDDSTPATLTAKYKGNLRSNSDGAFAGISQRKAARLTDGTTYVAYESQGKVWLEAKHPTNGWHVVTPENVAAPLSTVSSKLPSVAAKGGSAAVVFQRKNGSYSDIVINHYYLGSATPTVQVINTNTSFSSDMAPVIAFSDNSELMAVWKESTGLKYAVLPISSLGAIESPVDQGSVSNTTSASKWQSIAGNVYDGARHYHITWAESGTYIRYISYNQNTKFNYYSGNISTGSGYQKHRYPEIISTPNNDVWIGWWGERIEESGGGPDLPTKLIFPGGGGGSTIVHRALLRRRASGNGGWDNFYRIYGNDVIDVNINSTTDGKFMFTYAREASMLGSGNFVVLSTNLEQSEGISSGEDVKITNGSSSSLESISAYAVNLNLLELSESSSLIKINEVPLNIMPKISAEGNMVMVGREGITYRDTVQFYFAIGGIYIDDLPVSFVEIPDTETVMTRQEVNSYLKTEPFYLNDVSNFQYGVVYGLADTTSYPIALSGQEQLTFRVKLVDQQTNEVIGIYDEVNYDADSVYYYDNINYLVETEGIGNRQVRLELELTDNFEQSYSCSDMLLTVDSLVSKSFLQTLDYRGKLKVKEYELVQNYPNPFNPATIIKYNIPKSGEVKLRVFDILGREVTTLVNSYQKEGRYEVEFNASKLASGVYIYRLEADDFVNSKKMLLVK